MLLYYRVAQALYYRQIFGAGGAIIQKKNKEKEKGKGKEERREKRKKERGEFNLEDPMFPINFHSFFQIFDFFLPKNYKIKILNSLKDWLERENGAGGTRWRPPSQSDSFTMARSALLLTSFIITLDSMIYRITNFSLAGRQKKWTQSQKSGLLRLLRNQEFLGGVQFEKEAFQAQQFREFE